MAYTIPQMYVIIYDVFSVSIGKHKFKCTGVGARAIAHDCIVFTSKQVNGMTGFFQNSLSLA